MGITAFTLAQRFLGIHEVAGAVANPMILAMLRLDNDAVVDDSTPWCASFVSYIAWLLRLPRSRSLAARSWLGVGTPVAAFDAVVGFDVVILNRPPNPAAGHVGFFAGREGPRFRLLGGNQHDTVTIAEFDQARVIGVRRLVA